MKIRLCLVHVKYFRKINIFQKCYFRERKIFSNVLLHFKKCFEKYFLMFCCVLENTIENTFSTYWSHFLTFSQLPNKYIILFILQYKNTNKTQKKISSNPVKLREGRERGNWVWSRGEIAQRMRRRDRAAEVRSSGFGVDLCLISAVLRSTRPVECGSSDWSSVCGRWTRAQFEG